jgi:hypothetical protein
MMMNTPSAYWYRPPTKHPHGIFDNSATHQREYWEEGVLKSQTSEYYITLELARPPSIALLGTLHPWGHFPDLPR